MEAAEATEAVEVTKAAEVTKVMGTRLTCNNGGHGGYLTSEADPSISKQLTYL